MGSKRKTVAGAATQHSRRMRADAPRATTPARVELAEGAVLILDISRVSGAITYRPHGAEIVETDGEREVAELTTTRVVAHKTLTLRANNLKQSVVRSILRRHCASTLLGWVCPADRIDAFESDFRAARAEAAEIMREAHRAGVGIEVSAGYVPVTIARDNAAAAREIARTIVERFTTLRDALRAGGVEDRGGDKPHDVMTPALRGIKQLAALATDEGGRFALEDAIACAESAREALRAAKKEGAKSIRQLAAVGRELDLNAIETVIWNFGGNADQAPTEVAA